MGGSKGEEEEEEEESEGEPSREVSDACLFREEASTIAILLQDECS